MRTVSTMFLGLLLCLTNSLDATTIKVPHDYAKIQLAINAAVNGDTVLVSEGIYFENLLLKKKIVLGSLYIVDGDSSHISKTILDGSKPTNSDSASVILITTGTDSNTVISGFTIQRGHGTKIYISTYWDASWWGGGGICIYAGGAKISHNIIRNDTLSTFEGVFGGGIAIWTQDGPIEYWIIENNLICNNILSSTTTHGGAEGGGVHLTENGRFVGNSLVNNSADGTNYGTGGGIIVATAIGYGNANIVLANNYINGNKTSHWGGGIVAAIDPYMTLQPILTFENNIISNNTASELGGAMHFQGGTYTFINNTIIDNVGPEAIEGTSGRGVLTMRLLNNIIWNPGSTNEFAWGGGSFPKNIEISCSDIRGGYAGIGNIDADPRFVANDSQYHLSNSSPCIGAGISSASVGGVTLNAPLFDYFNTTRPRVSGSHPDIGAVENDLSLDEKTGLAVFGLGTGRSMSFREITLSEAGTQLRARYYGPYVVKKDSMAGGQHWFFEPGFNAWLWYGPEGLWLKFLPFTPTFDSSRNLFLKWPCKKGDTYTTRFLGLDVVATVDAVDSIITVPAFTDTCVVVTFRTSGQVMTRMCFAPGIGWIKEDDYYTNSTMDVIDFLPLVSYPHFRYEVTAFSPPTGVQELHSEIPLNWRLMQNYPNPFNPSTVISYQLPVISKVTLKIYDVLGREVETLVNEVQSAGWKEVRWNATSVSSGIYFYKLTALQENGGQTGNFVEVKKLMVLK